MVQILAFEDDKRSTAGGNNREQVPEDVCPLSSPRYTVVEFQNKEFPSKLNISSSQSSIFRLPRPEIEITGTRLVHISMKPKCIPAPSTSSVNVSSASLRCIQVPLRPDSIPQKEKRKKMVGEVLPKKRVDLV